MSLRSPVSPQLSPMVREMEEFPQRTSRLTLPPLPCSRCHIPFANGELHVMVDGTAWHRECFRCAQCFLPLDDDIYFNEGGRLYCEHDFQVLYAPCCSKCNNLIVGQVMRALNGAFHPHCFACEHCHGSLEDGVWHMDGKMLCFGCKEMLPKTRNYFCSKCKQRIDEVELLTHKTHTFHAYHFDCTDCGNVLSPEARTIKEELYCPRCFDLRCEICASCKKPIDSEMERSVLAMNRHWHVHHFRCVHCGVAFMGKEHYERNGKAYCKDDFVKLFGDYCHLCQKGLSKENVRFFNKVWCTDCYSCSTCNAPLRHKDKVAEFDALPMCKRCFKHKEFQKVLHIKEKEEAQREKAKSK